MWYCGVVMAIGPKVEATTVATETAYSVTVSGGSIDELAAKTAALAERLTGSSTGGGAQDELIDLEPFIDEQPEDLPARKARRLKSRLGDKLDGVVVAMARQVIDGERPTIKSLARDIQEPVEKVQRYAAVLHRSIKATDRELGGSSMLNAPWRGTHVEYNLDRQVAEAILALP